MCCQMICKYFETTSQMSRSSSNKCLSKLGTLECPGVNWGIVFIKTVFTYYATRISLECNVYRLTFSKGRSLGEIH